MRTALICVVGLMLLGARPLWAAQAAEAEHGAPAARGEAGHAEAEKPALLQFDPGAMVWSVVVFVVLLIVLRATAWKPILRVLNEREKFIEDSLARAKAEREKSAQLLADYEAQLQRARTEASGIVEEGRRDADVVRKRMLEDARRETAELTERARREVQLAADTAIKDLYDRTAALTVQLAERVLQRELSAADHQRLIDESLKEIRGNGTK